MLGFLFPRLTQSPERGAALFDAATAVARQPHWYVEGQLPDTIDGRFRMLATVTALLAVRLENEGADGDAASIALTERFVEAMEAEHREIGLGDPSLGKKVRNLVGALAKRVSLWRAAAASDQWAEAARDSLYSEVAEPAAMAHSAEALRQWWLQLRQISVSDIAQGKIR